MVVVLFLVSIVGGFLSGLLGVGGAVVLIPLMLAVPSLVGVGALTMSQVAGITMIQVLAATISGCLTHRRAGCADTKIILWMGVPMGLFSLTGALVSKYMSSSIMLVIFGCILVVAFVVLLQKSPGESDDTTRFTFNTPLGIITGGAVGTVSGVIGAGGGFILIPLMIRVLKIPIKIAVGSSLGVVFIGALMGSVGKIITLQVEWAYLAPVIAGSIPSAIIGARVSKAMTPVCLRYALLLIILLTTVKTWWDIISGLV